MDIIKTWPGFMDQKKVLRVFTHAWGRFYFSVGKGKPKQEVEKLWYTHKGLILGYFTIAEFFHYEREGQLPPLRSIENKESQWQFRPGIWIAICPPPFVRLQEELHYAGFQGWRYFELEKHRESIDALVAI